MAIPSAVMTFLKWSGAAGGTLAVGTAASPVLICGLLGLWLAGELQGAADAKRIEDRLAELVEKHGSVQSALEELGKENGDLKSKIEELLGAMKAAAESDAEIEEYVAGNQTLLLDLTQFVADQFDELRQVLGLADSDRIELLLILLDLQKGQQQLLGGQGEIKKAVSEATELLKALSSTKGAESADGSTREDLASAAVRVASEAARGGQTAESVLASKSPVAVAEFLIATRKRYQAAKSVIDARFEAELIELDREIAATAFVTGRIQDCEAALERILEHISDDRDAQTRLGHCYRLVGRFDEARKMYESALMNTTTKSAQSVSMCNIGAVEQKLGNIAAARKMYEQALEIDEQFHNQKGMAATLCNLGVLERSQGNLGIAEQHIKRSIEICEAMSDSMGVAAALVNLAGIEGIQGNYDRSEGYFYRALEINQNANRLEGIALVYSGLGTVERKRENLSAAEEHYRNSLRINRRLGKQEGIATELENLGRIEAKRGNIQHAYKLCQDALCIFKEIGMPHRIGHAQRLLDSLPPADSEPPSP